MGRTTKQATITEQAMIVQDLPIKQIMPSCQFRDLNPKKLAELKLSIESKGLLQPIRVRQLTTPIGAYRYKVSFGDHRLHVCQELGWKTIPSTIGTGNEAAETTLGIIENLHRNENVNKALLGDWFNHLIKDEGWDLSRCAHEVNKTTTFVESCLDIAEKVDPELHRQLSEVIPRSLAYDFSRVPMEDQRPLFELIRKRSAKRQLSRQSILMTIRMHGKLRVRGPSVYICENCGGLLTPQDVETGKAEAHHRKDSLFFVHAKIGDCEFNDTLVATYSGNVSKIQIREILKYAKEKLEDQGAQVAMRFHWARRNHDS